MGRSVVSSDEKSEPRSGAKFEPKPGPNSGSEAAARPGPVPGTDVGPELARAVLEAARAKRAERKPAPRQPRGAGRRLRGYSGPGPDPRDPQLFGTILDRLLKVRGWQRPAAEAKLFGAWTTVVGEELAAHSKPVKLE